MPKKTSADYEREYFRLRDNPPIFKYASESKKQKILKDREKQLRRLAKEIEKLRKIERQGEIKLSKEKERAIESRLKAEEKELKAAEKKLAKQKAIKEKREQKIAENQIPKKKNPLKVVENKNRVKSNDNKKTAKSKQRADIKYNHISSEEYYLDENNFADVYEEENEKISMRPTHLLRYIIVVLIVAGIGFFIANFDALAPSSIASYVEDLFSANSSKKIKEIDVSDINILSAGKTSKDIVLLSDTSIINYSKNGGLQFDRQHGYSSPRVKTSGTYILTYDTQSKKYRVDSRSKNIIDQTASNNIIAADISENKKIALVTESEGYAAELNIYNFAIERENFRWYSAENNVIDVSLSPNGTKVAVITIGTVEGQFVSYLTILDFSKSEPIAKTEYLNTILISVDFKTNSEVTVIGDNICSVVPVKNADKKIDYQFTESSLVTYDSNERGVLLVLAKYSDITKNELVFISQKGSVYFEETLDDSIISVSLSGRKSFVLTKNKLLEFDVKGKLIKNKEYNNEAYMISSLSNTSFIVGNSAIIVE